MKVKKSSWVGHWPTLLSAFLYFDVSFMVWVLLSLQNEWRESWARDGGTSVLVGAEQ